VSGEALTIGEVIGRLAADFPDLTVSKIRYLESGGLISPERTPAGYRRFSEEDVEKLRWVLAAQRDQYLPLKVIRQHLAADGPRVAAGDPEGILAALASGADSASEADPAGPVASRARVGGADAVDALGGVGVGVGIDIGVGTGDAAAPDDRLPPAAALIPPLPPIPQPRTRTATVADPEFFAAARADVGELHLGREGLARTAGVSESLVADLIAYGLLPNSEDYGGDAVFVVRAASALTEYGLEPRHLRPLLTGARNTAGLLSTLLPARRHDGVSGSGRQDAASRAGVRTAEASAAAVRLYAALLRAELVAEAAQAPAEASRFPSPSASRASSRNPGMPGGPAAR
jgi:DNA-binding transcriptional MerR regulator